uniref:glycine--tRNA ligase n=1 Tax=Chromera velia CCMP2878 TaxID=1169474 RepID=A0A0G4HU21_9ALVE|eukprot:Cvel_8554.t1-p1 / transcript=Cvel_8554.t1 / gene=Cvel_8554 / organism=Chromera_velia_CCMP2878 / gene_product=Glycine--tRNA ligase, putative / transcript_product=Glycine--tRNA ligase, putative / location=Cvel_scaffold474:67510-71758(-) / protein_length=686 / sequence_SO=supercontig / SO=protein_coding / is_pseudo=false
MPSIAPEAAAQLEETAAGLRADVARQGDAVKKMKQAGAGNEELGPEIAKLKALKGDLAKAEEALEDLKPLYTKCRERLESLLKRRFFVAPAFEIYGGVAGLFDFGPPGCAMKAELEAYWRRHFVLNEGMLEFGGTCMTPEKVLEVSGHVERFTDLMVKDETNGECFRADKLLEEEIEKRIAKSSSDEEKKSLEKLALQADAMTAEEIHEKITEFKIKSPSSGTPLSFPFPFNLMFKTSIGPQGNMVGFLRPETAQGIFVNFRRLLDYNNGRMPFAAAQLGLGFRNEIAPRAGLLRVREFQMAEIEHFVHPEEKDHPKFEEIKHLCLPLFPRDRQLGDGKVVHDLSIGEAVEKKVIDNETLGYFLARTYLFLTGAGIQREGLRFRQHLESEMAHYAKDCWDAEIETSYGWVECVGHADRSAYDLSAHTDASNTELVAHRKYDEPQIIKYVQAKLEKKKIGPAFKQDAGEVTKALEELSNDEKLKAEESLAATGSWTVKLCTGKSYEIKREMASFKWAEKKETEEVFVPAVIEPSFGMGRIMYAIWEHTFRSRGKEDQEERCYLAFPPQLAPTKVSILPISGQAQFRPFVTELQAAMSAEGVSSLADASTATIGKRYARTDEIGVPFGVTIDFQTEKDRTVTLRERDSMEQVRMPMDDVAPVLAKICRGALTWEAVQQKYPKFDSQEA